MLVLCDRVACSSAARRGAMLVRARLAVEVEGAGLPAADDEELPVRERVQGRHVPRRGVDAQQRDAGGRVRGREAGADAAGAEGEDEGVVDPQHVLERLGQLHLAAGSRGEGIFDEQLREVKKVEPAALLDADPAIDASARVEAEG